MFLEFSSPMTIAENKECRKAERIFCNEIKQRIKPQKKNSFYDITIFFKIDNNFDDDDSFKIKTTSSEIIFSAKSVRGLIYAQGLFFRKIETDKNKISLLFDISGNYSPAKKIRGHQLGYRPCSNTYDAWGPDEFERYSIELMFAGINTVEYIPYEKGQSQRNDIMRYDEKELLNINAEKAHKLGLYISIWYPNSEVNENDALRNRAEMFSQCPHIDAIFVPGADPGDLPVEELFSRCKKIRKLLKLYHPESKLFVSAQKPHNSGNWGNDFIKKMQELPDFIDGIIAGPNRAFDIDVLREKIPNKYPIRFYPDITHNLRCEYPVHFNRDDWNYALSTANSRESINPRPEEFRELHKITSPYVIGSVSYSEGVNDDINKFLWSCLDFNPGLTTDEILDDYSRLFFIGCNWKKASQAIKGLEKNWEGPPEKNDSIEETLKLFEELGAETPSLYQNWRYISCLFRAQCDTFIRRKLIFENSLIEKAKYFILQNNIFAAYTVLNTDFPDNIKNIRKDIDINAEKLYKLIGMQLSVSRFHASSWERGAVLDTIDLPITERKLLIKRINEHRDVKSYILRNNVSSDEFYYSVALDGLTPGGVHQTADFYMDFQGDRPNINNGDLPINLFKIFDHYVFRCKVSELKKDTDYFLQITYKNPPYKETDEHCISVNNKILYKGKQFGGIPNTDFIKDFLPSSFTAVVYKIPAEYIDNGIAYIEISEPHSGFRIAELRLTKTAYKSRKGDMK